MMLSIAIHAQREVGTLTFQPKAGLNVAYYSGAENVDTKPRLGVVAGVEFEYQLKKRFSLSAGVLYSQQGEKGAVNNFYVKREMTAKTDYMNFPILVNAYLHNGLALKVGVQPAVNIRAAYSSSGTFGGGDGNLSDYGVHVKTFDFAVPVGVSYEYKNFVIDARYNIGVTRVAEGDESRNRVFQFTLGYKINL